MAKINESYFVRRFVSFIIMVYVLLTVIFLLFRVMPGDPTAMLVSGRFDEETRQSLLESFGLDRPLHEQYIIYLQNYLTGDFGISFTYREPVLSLIIPKFFNTLIIMIPAMILIMLSAYYFGSYIGWNKGKKVETFGTFIPLTLRSIPHFVLGLFLIIIFSYWLDIFPSGGMALIGERSAVGFEQVTSVSFLMFVVLPIVTVYLYYLGDPFLLMRANIIKERKKDYVELLRVKGLPEHRVRRHAAKNSILPLLTWITPLVSVAIGGQILIEVVFSWPGIGREMVDAALRRDYPVAQAAFFITALLVIFTNLVIDFLYGYVDPRISYEGQR